MTPNTIPLCDAFFSCCIPQGRWNRGAGEAFPPPPPALFQPGEGADYAHYITQPLLVTDFEKYAI